MKKGIMVVVLVVSLLVTGVAYAAINALPGSGWWTSAGIQNVGDGDAHVILTAYASGTSDTFSASTTIPQNGSITFLPGGSGTGVIDTTPPLPNGFNGSMVLSSDQPLVAIGQIGNNVNGTLGIANGYASEMYTGLSAGAATISFPTVKNNFNGKTSTFYFQAAGSDVVVAATVKTNNGVSHTHTYNIAANKQVVVNTADFSPAIASTNCGDANTSPCIGALSATATGGTIVGVALETDTAVNPSTRLQAASMFASTDADRTVYCPVFKNNYNNRYTGMTVQNVSGGSADIYVTLVASAGGSGTFTTHALGVANGASTTFSGQIPNVGGFPSGAYGSVTITSTGTIIAAVNEANFNAPPYKATTYDCFPAAKATTKIAFPQVKENFGVNTTGVSVQNVGSASTTLVAKYTCNGVSYTANGIPLAKGATFTYYKPSQSSSGVTWNGPALPSSALCAVQMTASQKIVGIGQEAATTQLNTKNYEGFNLP